MTNKNARVEREFAHNVGKKDTKPSLACVRGTSNQTRFDPLIPRGNMGDSMIPKDKPKVATVFIPKTPQMRQDALELNRGLVIDARLRPSH